jgi:hypothetical protein
MLFWSPSATQIESFEPKAGWNAAFSEKDKIALQEKELASEGDATNIILNNPNLTPEERAIALKQLDEAEGQETKRNVGKFLLYGGIVILGYFIVTKFINKK